MSIQHQAGSRCPAALLRSLQSSQNLFDSITIVRPLQCTATCSVALCAADSGLCVVKSYQKYKLDDVELQQVHQEVELHRVLDVDWVVPFWVAVDEGSQLHIVTQFCQQSDLRSSLAASGPLSEAHVRDQVVIPLLHALRELHSKGYVHRDVKPDNVFMSAAGSALLGDFSLAVGPLPHTANPAAARGGLFSRCSSDSSTSGLTPTSSASLTDSDTPAASGSADSDFELGLSVSSSRSLTAEGGCHAGGTPAYCAPEVVLAAFNSTPIAEALGPQNDVWSLGIVAAECLMGCHPYGDDLAASNAVLHSIVSSQPLAISQLRVSAHCKDWLAAALARDPRQRWSAERLLKHAWITEQLPAAAQHGASTACLGAAAAAAAAGRAPAGHADAWDECWHSQVKAQGQQHAAAGPVPPPWVEDDWVTGLDRLSSQLEKANSSRDGTWVAQCRQQEQQQQHHNPSLLQHCQGARGITSWED